MENRSHALMAGIFTLALLLAGAAVAFWIGRDRGAMSIYEMVTTRSVNGLSTQSQVRFQGVSVGKVVSLRFDPDEPGAVRVRIQVGEDTPIRTSTYAELGTRGVTGLAVVELREDDEPGERVQTSAESPALIPIRPGTLQKLEERGTAILDAVERAANQMNRLVNDQNVERYEQTLASVSGLSQSLERSAQALQPAVQRAAPLMDALTQATKRADQTARDVGQLTQSARALLDRLQADGGPLDTATQSMVQLSAAVARLSNDTVPHLSTMAQDMRTAARSASRTMEQLGERPQSVLFGPAPVRAGPGEPGFTGFGRTP